MARTVCPDRPRARLPVMAALAMLAAPTAVGQVLIIVLAALVGWRLLGGEAAPAAPAIHLPIGRRTSLVAWALFFGLLIGLPLARQAVPSLPLAVFDSFYRVGSL